MGQPEFVHLHNHSDYSLLDGATRLSAMARRAEELGMTAMALTDHGNLFGAIDFYETFQKSGVKPIVGIEAYITSGHRSDRSRGTDPSARYFHLILLAQDRVGYQNLMRLSSKAYLEGFYYKPRIDHDLLAQHSEGLIGLSSCLKGEVPWHLYRDRHEEATEAALRYRDIFGEGNFFLELQDHGIEAQQVVDRRLIELSKKTALPLVATNDCHYLDCNDSEAHDLLLCIQTGKSVDHPKRMRYGSNQLYIKSATEMAAVFGHVDGALANTLAIAERCNLELEFGKLKLPHFPLPAGYDSADAYLSDLANQGFRRRYDTITPELEERLAYELGVIFKMGYAGYFLIVSDFVDRAREMGVAVGPGRGSAAGSLVSYSLGITNIDPMRFGLLFERFLNPERVSMPDIDIDFCFERRGEIIDYVVQKYGEDCVTQIITFGTMAARGVLRDVGRTLNLPYAEIDRIAKLVPNELGINLGDALERVPELKALEKQGPPYDRLIHASLTLEGLSRHASTHAAGVLITPEPLMDTVPLFKSTKGEVTTQFDMRSVEKIGLLKMDFLGLRTLTVVQKAFENIKRLQGVALTVEEIPLDDPETFRILERAETIGVFQVESGGMRDLLRRMRPEAFEDLIAVNALFRPGPLGSGMHDDYIARKHGKKRIEYEVPELEPILRETYGTILYQEQVMQIASELGGFSLAQADILRKAMGKKNPEEMARQRQIFVAGAVERQIPAAKAERIFGLMEHFAGYGFNKSHSAAYALISFVTAYLKAHYPIEFMAASLTSEMDSTDRIVILIDECRRLGINVLEPDVNHSHSDFTVEGEAIRFGLGAIKNVGRGVIADLVEARQSGGPFKSLFDLAERVDGGRLNRRVLESLVQSGAADCFGGHRAQLFEVVADALAHGQRRQRDRARGQASLFGEEVDLELVGDALPAVEAWDERTRLAREKELLGFYLSGHPLSEMRDEVEAMSNANTQTLAELGDGKEIRIVGLVSAMRRTHDRRGRAMAFVTLEDFFGTVEVLVFADAFEVAGDDLDVDQVVAVEGRLSTRENDSAKIVAEAVMGMARARQEWGGALEIELDKTEVAELLKPIESVLAGYPGAGQVVFRILDADGNAVSIAAEKLKVGISGELIRGVGQVVGTERVRLTPRRRSSSSVQ